MLNSEQLQVKKNIVDFINNFNDSFYLLNGAAGTGKTFTISAVISHLQDVNNRIYIAGLAPTHKAVNVLKKSSLNKGNHNIDYMTVHQCLGLKLTTKGDKQFLEQGFPNTIDKYELLIVDECSMISEQLWTLIKKIAEQNPFKKFVFLGDKAQLNPVNEGISPVFSEITKQSELTVNMRTGIDNPIYLNIQSARKKVFTPNLEIPLNTDKIDGFSKGTWMMNQKEWLQAMIKAFKSDKFQSNTDYVKAIAWRNSTVDYINSFVRSNIYNTEEPYVIGDRLVCKESVFDPYDHETVLIPNNSEIQVLGLRESQLSGYNCIWLTVFCKEEGLQTEIPVLHRDSVKSYYGDLRAIATANKQSNEPDWDSYWRLKNRFAKLNYGYAMTAHKAQGSTYDHAFIHINDIKANSDKVESNRCLYVAYSRARERLFLC